MSPLDRVGAGGSLFEYPHPLNSSVPGGTPIQAQGLGWGIDERTLIVPEVRRRAADSVTYDMACSRQLSASNRPQSTCMTCRLYVQVIFVTGVSRE